ncbi:MAG: hypothetical protein ACTTKH_00660 [Treponema sp.]
MKKISFFIFSLLVLFSCKQNSNTIKSVLKIHNIAVDGNSISQEELKKGSATINYKNSTFELKIDAEVLNVRTFLSIGNSKREITKNLIDGTPFVATTDKNALCKITFEGDDISDLEYRFRINHISKEQTDGPTLTSLTVGEKKITEIEDKMSVSLSSPSERLPIMWETEKDCKVSIRPELQEGMLKCSFDADTEVYITLEGEKAKTYQLTVRLVNSNVTEEALRLTFLKVYGKEIKPIQDRNHFVVSYDAPYNIPLEVLANNGAEVETEPALQNGKISVAFNQKETVVKMTCKREGFASRTYFLNIEREQEQAELRSLKVNGHLVDIQDVMNVSCTYAKNDALIEAVGKNGNSVSFNPSLNSSKITLTQGTPKKLEITVSKDGLATKVYTLNLTREATPSSRPSSVESVMISVGKDATRNFIEIDKDFPSKKDNVKYEISTANEYTLRIEKINSSDVITVTGSDNNAIASSKTEDLVSYYNLKLKDVESDKSSIEEIKIHIKENNMQERDVVCKMCFQGAWAEATKRPKATIGTTTFEPLLTKINYLTEGGRVKLELEAYDELSKVTQEDGSSFPVEFDVGDDIKEIGFILTTVTGKKITHKMRFKKAIGKERTLLEYLKFYPEKPDLSSGYYKEYSQHLSPSFKAEIEDYKLELKAGDYKVFFDLAPIIKTSNAKVYIDGQDLSKEEYFNDHQGNRLYLYALTITANATRSLLIEVVSDLDPSITKQYKITVVAPNDDIVANYEAFFYANSGKRLFTVPAVGKQRGIRLPPQDYDAEPIKMRLEAKTEGITFQVKKALVTFNKQGKIEKFTDVYNVQLDENNSAVIPTGIGMNFIVVQARARNGISIVIKTYEVYKFSQTNKVKLEFSDGTNTKVIEPNHYQMLENIPLNAPMTFKGSAGENAGRFVIQAFSDAQANKPFKVTRVDDREFKIPQVPKIVLAGVIMPDNTLLYYAVFFK